ncbi:MAG TPA: hypothetical protein PLN93_03210 [Vicinamibacterales bacterium]|nr:hypothetical protein [Vicinamibacterales bacterium]HOQ59149.1 hypothetical protein [Vicinamibacterales bacterium]HPK70927.1 hypothetical protein [Vicinamibacterales bacterium]
MTASIWRRLGCCLSGHDYSVKSDGTRMFLRCRVCGRTSRGLIMGEDPCRRRSRHEQSAAQDQRPAERRTPLSAR